MYIQKGSSNEIKIDNLYNAVKLVNFAVEKYKNIWKFEHYVVIMAIRMIHVIQSETKQWENKINCTE
eukprot:snap_masked-scaffold_10-processed-gene-8.33-mRNA-1 protein AED:1.00 eAED:1.00 QI:0/-1/0/0/-1/1/1/0/66